MAVTREEAQEAFARYLVNKCDDCGAPVGELCKENNAVWVHASRMEKVLGKFGKH